MPDCGTIRNENGKFQNFNRSMYFKIDDKEISHSNLQHWASEIIKKDIPEWIKSIATTITEWYDDSFYITVHTSGSTGNPKPIPLSKKAMSLSAEKTAAYFKLSDGITALLCLPADFIAGKMMIIRALVNRWNLICIPPRSSLEIPSETSFQFVAMTPFQFKYTSEGDEFFYRNIETILLGGSPLTPEIKEMIMNISTGCYLSFGMTETITHVALMRINGKQKENVFTGVEGVSFSQNQGRLVINANHLDIERIETNDIVEIINNKQFRWLGRSDHVINSAGLKIHPEQIEEKIAHLIPFRFIITGKNDLEVGQQVVLIIESNKMNNEKLVDLNRSLHELLGIKRPRRILFVDQLQETTNGKLKRNFKFYFPEST